MLETCQTPEECERILQPLVEAECILRDVVVSESDHKIIEDLIRQFVSSHSGNIANVLFDRFPTCTACCLVNIGHLCYKEGDLWTAVADRLLIADRNQQNTLGHRFKQFLRANSLPIPEVETGDHLVAAILLHGTIPVSCYDEFSKGLVEPLITDYVIEPFDVGEVRSILTHIREDELRWVRLEESRKDLSTKLERCRAEARRLSQTLDCLDVYGEYVAAAKDVDAGLGSDLLSDDPESLLAAIDEDISELEIEKGTQEEQSDALRRVIDSYDQASEEALRTAAVSTLESCAHVDQLLAQREALQEQRTHLVQRLAEESNGVLNSDSASDRLAAVRSIPLKLFATLGDQVEYMDLGPMPGFRRRLMQFLVSSAILIMVIAGLRTEPRTILYAGTVVGAIATLVSAYDLAKSSLERLRREAVLKGIWAVLGELPLTEDALALPLHELLMRLAIMKNTVIQLDQVCGKLRSSVDKLRRVQSLVRKCCCDIGQHSDLGSMTEEAQWDDEHLYAALDRLNEVVREMSERRASVDKASAELEAVVQPRIVNLDQRIQKLKWEKQNIIGAITELGSGQYDEGLKVLSSMREQKRRVEELRDKLCGLLPDGLEIDDISRLTDSAGYIQNQRVQLSKIAEELDQQIDVLAAEQRKTPHTPLRYLSEPIKRYILFGREHALEFVAEAVSYAIGRCLDGKHFLPDELTRSLEALNGDRSTIVDYGRRFLDEASTVRLLSDINRGLKVVLNEIDWVIDLEVGPVTFYTEIDMPTVRWTLSDANSETIFRCYSPRLYGSSYTGYRIEPFSLRLDQPADGYRLTLEVCDKQVFVKEFAGVTDPGLMVLAEGKMLPQRATALPARIVWLVFDDSLCPSFNQDSVLCEALRMSSGWERYRCAQLDLSQQTELRFTSSEDSEEYCLPVGGTGRRVTVHLCGGRIAGVTAESDEIVVAPDVRLSVEMPGSPGPPAWRISVKYVGKNQSLHSATLDSLVETCEQLNDDRVRVDVPLFSQALGVTPQLGRYRVLLVSDRDVEWSFGFCYLPGLSVEFDELLYPLAQPDSPYLIESQIRLPVGVGFCCSDGEMQMVDDQTVQLRLQSNAIGGWIVASLTISGTNESSVEIPLVIEVPRLACRLDLSPAVGGEVDEWMYEVREVMLSDWATAESAQLVIRSPSFVDGVFSLRVVDGDHSSKGDMDGNLLCFDLMEFVDTLRSFEEIGVLELISPPESPVKIRCPVMRVRPRWRAERLRVSQIDQRGSTQLTWTDIGTASNRRLGLWSPLTPSIPVVEIRIPDGASEVLLDDPAEVPDGTYISGFFVEDGWSGGGQRSLMTSDGLSEVHVIDIGESRPIAVIEPVSTDGEYAAISVRVASDMADTESMRVAYLGVRGIGLATRDVSDAQSGRFIIKEPEYACWVLLIDGNGDVRMIWRRPGYEDAVCLPNSEISSILLSLRSLMKTTVVLSDLSSGQRYQRCNSAVTIQLMELIRDRNTKGAVDVGLGGRPKWVILDRSATDPRLLRYQKGVLCTTCHQLVSDQATWNEDHYNQRHCKSMDLEPEETRLGAEVLYDYFGGVKAITSKYEYPGELRNELVDRLLTVYPIPGSPQPSISHISKEVARMLDRTPDLIDPMDRWKCIGAIAGVELATLYKFAEASRLVL